MNSRIVSFNFYFLLLLVLAGLGCKTTEEKKRSKQASTIRLHLETNPDGTAWNTSVSVLRERPLLLNVERQPFLTEADVLNADLVEAVGGGIAIRLLFNRHGTFVLDSVTASKKGRRIGVHSTFGDARWLAAPLIRSRISDGTLIFTPDADREEAERIVRGINNVVAEIRKRARYQ